MKKLKYPAAERYVPVPVNGQRNGTGRDRREECLNSVFEMKIQYEVYLLQLKPGVPLPSPKDLLGKILIKNKKNQSISGKRQSSLKKGRSVEPEIIEQPAPVDAQDTGMSEGKMGLVELDEPVWPFQISPYWPEANGPSH